MKSPLRASEDYLASSMQSTPATSQPCSASLRFAAKKEIENGQTDEDVWNVWPYSWAIASHDAATERFHSFHTKLNSWLLARHNRRVLSQHRASLQGWNCEAGARLID